MLSGEGQYNLNILKEIKCTSSFNGMNQGIRKCQNKESFDECKTRQYEEVLRKNCGCIPFEIRLLEQVQKISRIIK